MSEDVRGAGVTAECMIEATAMGRDPRAEIMVVRWGGGLRLIEQWRDFRIATLIEEIQGEVVEGGGKFRTGGGLPAAGKHLAEEFFGFLELPEILKGQGFRFIGIR